MWMPPYDHPLRSNPLEDPACFSWQSSILRITMLYLSGDDFAIAAVWRPRVSSTFLGRSETSADSSPWRDVTIPARPLLGRLPRACGDIPRKGTAMKFRSYVAASLLALGVLCMAAPALAADVHMFVRHEVADYATWKKAYDGFRATQKKMGVVAQAVYQSVDNPNDVTVTHDFHSLEQAKAFAASPELKSAMEKAGVKGAPQIWYTTKGAK